jgi:hypothetical protein
MHVRSCERCRVDCSFFVRDPVSDFHRAADRRDSDFVDTFRKVVAFAWVVSLVWLAVLGVSRRSGRFLRASGRTDPVYASSASSRCFVVSLTGRRTRRAQRGRLHVPRRLPGHRE